MVRYILSVTTDTLNETGIIAHQGEDLAHVEQLDVAYELTDFADSRVLDNKELVRQKVRHYLQVGLPSGSVMMGAFEDLSLFSRDEKIRSISFGRMRQCLKIAQKLALDSVLFYLNIPLYLENSPNYIEIRDTVCIQLRSLLEEFSQVNVCFENKAEPDPRIFLEIFNTLEGCKNVGFCLNYSRAALSYIAPEKWAESLSSYCRCLRVFDSRLQEVVTGQDDNLEVKCSKYKAFAEKYCSTGSILFGKPNCADISFFEEEIEETQWLDETDSKETLASVSIDSPETLLEKIFFYMNRLVGDKDFLSTILLLTDMGRTLAGSDRASFWYWDKKKKQYWTIVALECDRIVVEEGAGIVGASIQNNEVLIVNDTYADNRFYVKADLDSGYTSRSILCIPVIDSKGNVIGAFQALNKLTEEGYGKFEEQDVRRLAMAAAYCGRTLEAYLLYQETLVDALTGVKNRRGFWEYYAEELEGQLNVFCASLLMCDIDYFKTINDTYGHACGDQVLVAVSEFLEQMVGDKGAVARWGGEEFVIILKEHHIHEAVPFAEQVRTKIEETAFLPEYPQLKFTVSFGVAEITSSLSIEKNVDRADKKLYEAKTNGRNQVRF